MECFPSHYDEVVEKTVPLYHESLRVKKKWMTKAVLKLVMKKEETWRAYRKCKSKRNLKRYRSTRNATTTAIRKAKYDFEHRLAREVRDNPRSFLLMHEAKHQSERTCRLLRREMAAQRHH